MKIQINERMKQILDSKELEVMEAVIEGAEDWYSVEDTLMDGQALESLEVEDTLAVSVLHAFARAEREKYNSLHTRMALSSDDMDATGFIRNLYLLIAQAKEDSYEINCTEEITEALDEMTAEEESRFLDLLNKEISRLKGHPHYQEAFFEIEKFQVGDGSEGNPCFQ